MRYAKGLTSFGIDCGFSPLTAHNFFLVSRAKACQRSAYPVTVTLPTAAGFGSNGFYGQGFGYFSTGAEVSVPLAFIPGSFGSWKTNTVLITVAEVDTAHIGKIALSISNRDSGVTKIDLFYPSRRQKLFFLRGLGAGTTTGFMKPGRKALGKISPMTALVMGMSVCAAALLRRNRVPARGGSSCSRYVAGSQTRR